MRVALLTTSLSCRIYFAEKVNNVHPFGLVVVEETAVKPPFDTAHPFETEQESYENSLFFKGGLPTMENVAATVRVSNINDGESLVAIQNYKPEVLILFGTRKAKPSILRLCPAIINLHRGDPERYRGLDSHLWQIYHRDFSPFVTTIHRVNDILDDGEIILQDSFSITKDLAIHKLRSRYVQSAVQLTVSSLDMFSRHGDFISRPQCKAGRYYSFMPAAIKETCATNYSRYIESL
ncbi:MAG: hypothetical protein J5J00_11050 [Deltaproteobacteria bacterium]|nr:hypothetical protein [Deltaproteobacteria bacterium]